MDRWLASGGYLIDIAVPFDHQIATMGVYCLLATGVMSALSRHLRRRALSAYFSTRQTME